MVMVIGVAIYKYICDHNCTGRIYAISASHSLGKIKAQKNPAIKDWIVENKKNGRPFSLNSENSLKLNRLQVNQLWSSFRYLAKTSLFLPFYTAEKNFQLKRKDFFSETTAKCPEKRGSSTVCDKTLQKNSSDCFTKNMGINEIISPHFFY